MLTNSAPVESVGGPQQRGPWPDDVAEIATGEAYQRPVTVADGSRQELDIVVTGVNDILDESGIATGTAVTFQYDDPTDGQQVI